MAQAAEVLGPDSLGGLDLDADHSAGRMLQHHVHLNLVAVAVVEELDGLFGPGELAGYLADREVLIRFAADLPLTARAICRLCCGRSAAIFMPDLPMVG